MHRLAGFFKLARDRSVTIVDHSDRDLKIKVENSDLKPEIDPIFRTRNDQYKTTYASIANQIDSAITEYVLLLRINQDLHTVFVNTEKAKHFTTTASDIPCWLVADIQRTRGVIFNRSNIESLTIQSCESTDNQSMESLMTFFAISRALGKARTFGVASIKKDLKTFLAKLTNCPANIFKTRKKK
jgi:hypothetical protein